MFSPDLTLLSLLLSSFSRVLDQSGSYSTADWISLTKNLRNSVYKTCGIVWSVSRKLAIKYLVKYDGRQLSLFQAFN